MNTQNYTLSKYTVSFGLSLALTSVINALLVVAKEKSPALQSAMQKITGSHWITHAAVVLILFIAFGWLFAGAKNGPGPVMPVNRLIKTICAGVFTAAIVIVGFYLLAD